MAKGSFHELRAILWLILGFMLPLAIHADPTFTSGTSQGTISIAGLIESSGIAASRNNDSVLWTHNDSGDTARIFAVDTQGRLLGIYTLPGAANVDYEDIAMGPGPVANVLYIYIGDIGDNAESRANIKIYQIPEPAVYQQQYLNPVNASLKGLRTITLAYPDGPHNAEALMVDPLTGDLFIATKHTTTSSIYTVTKAQLDATNSLTLSFVRTINFNIVSGGDISPNGREIVLRQENFAKLWKRLPGQTVSNALATTSVTIPVIGTPTEPNGEAIGFDAIGSGYYTISESASSQPLYYFARTSNDGPKIPRTLLSAGSAWKYLDDGSNQGSAWRNPGFNDAAWASGIGRFGYSTGSEQTTVSYGPNPAIKYATTYFRTTFQLFNAVSITNLVLKLLFNDGAAVYLNGTAVVRTNLNPNATYSTYATLEQSALTDTWFNYPVAPSLLINGTNTLAVEIHQISPNDTDLSFDLQLVAMEASQPKITSGAMGSGQFKLQLSGPSDADVTVQTSTNLTNWANLGNLTLTNGAGTFSDQQASNFTQRFYRTVQ
jgi:hypothetical protein